MLPSRALKHWNIPHSLDFKGKTVANIPRRSHFLSEHKKYDNKITNYPSDHSKTILLNGISSN